MDAKKIERALQAEKRPETVRITLNVARDIAERMQARYPRNRQPSLSKVTETLWAEFLDAVSKAKK